MSSLRLSLGAGASLICLLSGCSRDAAAEEAVQVQPGLYEVRMEGQGPSPFMTTGAPAELDKEVCVTADEAEFFPQVYTRRYLSMDGQCSGPLSERTGNQVTGKLSCPLDTSKATGEFKMDYAAAVSAQQVDVDVLAKLEISGGDPEKLAEIENSALTKDGVALTLTVRRIGDC